MGPEWIYKALQACHRDALMVHAAALCYHCDYVDLVEAVGSKDATELLCQPSSDSRRCRVGCAVCVLSCAFSTDLDLHPIYSPII